jgi:regulator of sigma E protease
MSILVAVIMFCLLVFVHEFGHFAVAKALGIKVNEFSIGMGPLIFQKKKGDTEYSLRAFPIGGYCKMEGEDEESQDERAFNKQPAWAKALVIVAGALMNILTTIVILTAVMTYAGSYTTTLDQVAEGYPAALAGLQAGDVILAVNGESSDSWTDVVTSISQAEGQTVQISILRGNSPLTLISAITENEEGRKVIGITPEVSHSLFKGIKEAFITTGVMTSAMGEFLAQLLSGRASSSDVVGPIGIVSIIGQQAEYGIINVIYLMALISLNLGMVNLLPLPALDGGRLLFIVIRSLSGGRISDEAESKVHFFGMVLLMALMIFLVFKDTFQFLL